MKNWLRCSALAVGAVTALLAGLPSAFAQAQVRGFVAVLETIGESPAAREAVIALAEKSPALRALAAELGLSIAQKSAPKELLLGFEKLGAAQRGAIILHDPELSQTLLSSGRLSKSISDQSNIVSSFNSMRQIGVGKEELPRWMKANSDPLLLDPSTGRVFDANNLKELRVLAAPSVERALAERLLLATRGATRGADVELSEPLKLCSAGVCDVKTEKISIGSAFDKVKDKVIDKATDKVIDKATDAVIDNVTKYTATGAVGIEAKNELQKCIDDDKCRITFEENIKSTLDALKSRP